jgi:hypothetical protein
MKRIFVLQPYPHPSRTNCVKFIQYEAEAGMVVTVAEPKRSSDANSAMWPILQAFADQLQWPVNGAMVKMSPEDWKTVLSAAFKRETVQVAQGLDGGMVMLGMRTSKMGKKEFGEWLGFLNATVAIRGVVL